jgi:hypothetical protein
VSKKCAFHDTLQAGKQKEVQAPDQGSVVDFFLFPRLKSMMKGARFADVAAIQERVTAVLRSIAKEARLLGLRVRIPPGAWKSVCCEYCVLSD